MFCSKCGKEISNDSKFCSSCGAQINNIWVSPIHNINSLNVRQISFDTKTIIFLVISAVMLLSMLILPMFKLNTYTISLLGDNYMASNSTRDTINTLSRVAFIFMSATTIATTIFHITKKMKLSFILSCVNGGILFLYIVYVPTIWLRIRGDRTATIGAGTVLCALCSIVLIVLSLLDLKKVNPISIKQNILKSIEKFQNTYTSNYKTETSNNGKVDFGKAITLYFKNYANFEGRASKSEYWWAFLFNLIISFLPLYLISLIAFIVPSVSITVRRLHDIGKSGRWCLIGLIPIVGTIILIMWLIKDSDTDNQWGPAKNTSNNIL